MKACIHRIERDYKSQGIPAILSELRRYGDRHRNSRPASGGDRLIASGHPGKIRCPYVGQTLSATEITLTLVSRYIR